MRADGRSEPAAGQRTLFSILFTDIVDSTAQAVARGSAAWRDIVRGHNEMAERETERHEGRLVKDHVLWPPAVCTDASKIP